MCMEIGLGNDVGRFGWREHGVREELLDQIGIVRLQELHEVGVDVLVDLSKQLFHLELLFAQFSHELIYRIVEVNKACADHSQVTVPLLLGHSVAATVRRMRGLPGGLPLTLPRS